MQDPLLIYIPGDTTDQLLFSAETPAPLLLYVYSAPLQLCSTLLQLCYDALMIFSIHLCTTLTVLLVRSAMLLLYSTPLASSSDLPPCSLSSTVFICCSA
jgi:hypothetical protein